MLTDSEKAWLNNREIFYACTGYFNRKGYSWEENLQIEDMQDAAKFEARVAAKLASDHAISYYSLIGCLGDKPGTCDKFNRNGWDCADCRLKLARLAVEEEMDAEMDK